MNEPRDLITDSLAMYITLHLQAYASLKAAQALDEMYQPWISEGLFTSDQTSRYIYAHEYAMLSRGMLCPVPDDEIDLDDLPPEDE